MKSKVRRETKETKVELMLDLAGGCGSSIRTGLGFLDHMLDSFACHSGFCLYISAESRDKNEHHLVEDVAICLGEALQKALPEAIERFGGAMVPMDDSMAIVAVDLGGRPYTNITLQFSDFKEVKLEDVSKENIIHFLETLVLTGRFNLYARVEGKNDHHKVEALFKALGRAMRDACRPGRSASTKGGILC